MSSTTALSAGTAVISAGFGAALVVPRPPIVVPVIAAAGAVLLVVAGIGGARR